MNKWIKKVFGVQAAVEVAVEAAVEETISAAERLIPDFPAIRDAKAKAGVLEYKDGRQMVRTGERKMDDGAEDVELAQKLGSRIKLPK